MPFHNTPVLATFVSAKDERYSTAVESEELVSGFDIAFRYSYQAVICEEHRARRGGNSYHVKVVPIGRLIIIAFERPLKAKFCCPRPNPGIRV
jgi:hypothetical protein